MARSTKAEKARQMNAARGLLQRGIALPEAVRRLSREFGFRCEILGERAARVNVAHNAFGSIQMAPLSWRRNSVVRAMVSSVSDFVCAPGRNGCRAGIGNYGQLHLAMGSSVRPGTGQTLSA